MVQLAPALRPRRSRRCQGIRLWGRALLVLALAAGCAPATAPLSEADKARILAEELARLGPEPAAPVPPGSPSEAPPPAGPAPEPAAKDNPLERPVTLAAVATPLSFVLGRLAEAAGVELQTEPEVQGASPVSIQLQDVPVRQALERILDPLDLSFRLSEGRLIIYRFETRGWTLSLPALTTTTLTKITNQTVAPGTTGAGAGTTGASSTGTQTITPGGVSLGAQAETRIMTKEQGTWEELEKALRQMLSPDGRLSVNQILGLVTIRDRPRRLDEIHTYLLRHEASAAQEVSISVRAFEVTLEARDQYGVDWQRVFHDLFGTTAVTATGAFATPLTLPLSLSLNERGRLNVLIKALSSQGQVRVLAQPSIRVLQGHPAVIQVARVRAFVAEADQTITGTGGLSTASIRLGSVQDGVILPLTARVTGQDIVLHLSPVISRVREIRSVRSGNVTVEAPDVDNRAITTTVRLKSGETVVLGGLISTENQDQRQGLPILLRAVPGLGWLLGTFDQRAARTEVVLTLTPVVVERPAAAPAPRG